MNIVIVCDYFDEFAEYHESVHVRYLLKLGHKVAIICSTYANVFEYYGRGLPPNCVQVSNYHEAIIYRLPYGMFLFKRLFYFKNLLRYLKMLQPDFIYAHGINLNNILVVFYKMLKRKEIKLICDFHGDDFNSAKNLISKYILHRVIYRALYLICENAFNKIFAVSPSSIKFILKYYGGNLSKINLLPLGSDSLRIQQRFELGLFRKGPIIPDYSLFTIITGGKLHSDSRIELLFDAISQIPPQIKIKLIIFGSPREEYRIQFNEILEKYSQRVIFEYKGWLNSDNIIDLFLSVDLAVFLGGQSVLWQVAISSGLPLILSNTYRAEFEYLDSKYIDNGGNIAYVELGSGSHHLREKLCELAVDVELVSQMKICTMKVADEVLDMNKIIKEILDV